MEFFAENAVQTVARGWRSSVLVGWHLLSLDAPTVAMAWTWWIGRTTGVALPWTELMSMFVAVWVLYAADRLLDARGGGELEARHYFHQRHGARFRWTIGLGCVVLSGLLMTMSEGELSRYGVLGVLLVGWFVLIHSGDRPLPKELVVGIFFAAAVFIPVVVRAPWLRGGLVVPALLFGGLCSLNCLFIYAWEHEAGPGIGVHASTHWAVRHVGPLAGGLAVGALALGDWPVALGAGLLFAVHCVRGQVETTTLRGLADLMLAVPVLLGAVLTQALLR